MSNQTQTLEQVVKRIVGAAFDAGAQAATRPRAERDRQRMDQAEFAAVMIRGQVDAERAKPANVRRANIVLKGHPDGKPIIPRISAHPWLYDDEAEAGQNLQGGEVVATVEWIEPVKDAERAKPASENAA